MERGRLVGMDTSLQAWLQSFEVADDRLVGDTTRWAENLYGLLSALVGKVEDLQADREAIEPKPFSWPFSWLETAGSVVLPAESVIRVPAGWDLVPTEISGHYRLEPIT